MIFENNKTYDVLKWINAIAFPAIITCFLAISKILEWQDAVIIGGILNALNTCLGSLLGVGNYRYKQEYATDESIYKLDDLEVEESNNEERGNG